MSEHFRLNTSTIKIGVIGVGKLGLCFALLLEKAGYDVIVSDCRESHIENIIKKKITTNEPGVTELLNTSKNITAVHNNKEVIEQADIIYTFVATPSLPSGSYDIGALDNIINDIKTCESSVKGKGFVVGCTTNPGDCEVFRTKLKDHHVDVYYSPTFIAQGSIMADLQYDMILIGGDGKHLDSIKEIHYKIQKNDPNIHVMKTTSAEVVKLAMNCFLTTKITFANTIGQVLSLNGHYNEIDKVLSAIASQFGIGRQFLNFGFGYGGPCLPRDNRSFTAYAKKLGINYDIGIATDKLNNNHLKFLTDWHVKQNRDNLPFAFPYVSYKADTNIIEESQQYKLCINLLNLGYKVFVVNDGVKKDCDSRITWGSPQEDVYWITGLK